MSRRRALPATPGADWDLTRFGFCKGVLSGHHPYNHERARLTQQDDGTPVLELTCRACKTERRTAYPKGKKAKHHYDHPPGYVQPTGKHGVTEDRARIRGAWFDLKLR